MTTKVHGKIKQGMWFSKDARVVKLSIGTGTTNFLADLTAIDAGTQGTDLEEVVQMLATRSTIIGLTVFNETDIHVLVDYANALDDVAVQDLLKADIETLASVTSDVYIGVEEGFTSNSLGEPA